MIILLFSLRVTLEIIQDTEEDEVEFDKAGSWKPVEKSELAPPTLCDLCTAC